MTELVVFLVFVLSGVGAYFLGCFNGAVIVSKYILRDDVRTHGSGNAGLTNFYRVFGGKLTAVVLLMDVVKAVLAVLLGSTLLAMVWAVPAQGALLGKYYGGLFCLLGHMFPCMFKFKGGKGILSGGVMAIMIDWRVALVVWGGFLILSILTRYVSLGSIWAGASFPFATWFVFQDLWCTLLAVAIGGLILWQHRGNMRRLLRGEENKFSLHHKGEKK